MNAFNKKAVAAIGVVVIAGVSVYLIQQRRLGRAEAEQRRMLAALEQSSSENTADVDVLKATEQQIKALRKEARALPRLRNEVTQLRRQKAEKAIEVGRDTAALGDRTTEAPLPPGKYISKEQLAFAGYETPEASAQSGTWSLVSGNYEVRSNAMSSIFGQLDRAEFDGQSRNLQWGLKGIQILARKSLADDTVELKVRMDLRGSSSVSIWQMLKVGNEWKNGAALGAYSAEWDKTGTVESFTP